MTSSSTKHKNKARSILLKTNSRKFSSNGVMSSSRKKNVAPTKKIAGRYLPDPNFDRNPCGEKRLSDCYGSFDGLYASASETPEAAVRREKERHDYEIREQTLFLKSFSAGDLVKFIYSFGAHRHVPDRDQGDLLTGAPLAAAPPGSSVRPSEVMAGHLYGYTLPSRADQLYRKIGEFVVIDAGQVALILDITPIEVMENSTMSRDISGQTYMCARVLLGEVDIDIYAWARPYVVKF